jgi:hypothetical protein
MLMREHMVEVDLRTKVSLVFLDIFFTMYYISNIEYI